MAAPPSRLSSILERWLAFPRALWLSLGAAFAVALPGIRVGFFPDDFVALGVLTGAPSPGPVYNTTFSLYRYAVGDPTAMQESIAKGLFPWWTLPELKLAFYRPFASALLWLEHLLFGLRPMPWLAHSLLWYLAFVAVVGLLLRRLLPGTVGGLALLFFAVDDTHAVSVASVVDRIPMLATFGGFLGLLCHVLWREEGRIRSLVLSLFGWGLGLASGETVLGVYGYLVAYELLAAPGTAGARLRALAPAGFLLAVWAAIYTGLGYGCYGSDFFVNPLTQPGDWLRALPTRLPILVGALLLNVPADFAAPDTTLTLIGIGLGGLALFGLLLRACWGGLTDTERRHVPWLVAGAALSLPATAVMPPSNRLLIVPSLGAAVAIAVVAGRVWTVRRRSNGWRAMALVAGLLTVIHLAVSPFFWQSTVSVLRRVGTRSEEIQQVLTKELDLVQLPRQRVAVLAVPSVLLGVYIAPRWWATGQPLPRSWWTLSFAPTVHRVTRTGPATLEMELLKGRFFTSTEEHIHRTAHVPLGPGTVVPLDGARAEVAEVDGEGIRRLRFVFDVPLEDPSLVLLHWKDAALRRFVPPPVGGSVEINRLPNRPR